MPSEGGVSRFSHPLRLKPNDPTTRQDIQTIAAIATAPGEGAIGIIRLSGPEALGIAREIFRAPSGAALREFSPRKLERGTVRNPCTEEPLDECLLAVMPGPDSYTGEDVAEIHAHGGPLSLRSILRVLVDLGARPAEPGEFTRRAFLNGRLDLVQAEAVADIISARSETALRAALGHLSGRLSRELEGVWEALVGVSAQLEAAIDFPDEHLEIQSSERLVERTAEAAGRLRLLLESFHAGRAIREGTPVAILGRPNVGKSSLLNQLLREDRALTSPIPGTTRDTIEETAVIEGLPFHFIDTAGLRDSDDPIERAGIARARRLVESAALILIIIDGSEALAEEDEKILGEFASRKGQPAIGVLNKSDLPAAIGPADLKPFFEKDRVVSLSSLRGDGLGVLEEAMVNTALRGGSVSGEIMLTRERHRERVKAAQDSVEAGISAMRKGVSPELVAIEFTEAMNALAGLLGKDFTEDLLDSIFSDFCIGK